MPNLTARAEPSSQSIQLARNAGVLAGGGGIAQIVLFLSLPPILHLYGVRTFGLFSTVLAVASVAAAVVDIKADAVILFTLPRHRALRLLSAQLGTTGCLMLVGYGAILSTLVCFPAFARSLGTPVSTCVLWTPALAFSQTTLVLGRAWAHRCGHFKVSGSGQVLRALVFAGVAVAVGFVWSGQELGRVNGLLAAQTAGDLAAAAVCLQGTRGVRRRLLVPWPPRRALQELRSNRRFMGVSWFTSLLAVLSLNIPLWAIGAAFGLSPAGWFSAARRLVLTPVQFASSTLGVVVNQRIRQRREHSEPIAGELTALLSLLIGGLAPFFGLLAWVAASGHLVLLGAEWSPAGPTVIAMTLVGLGATLYASIEGLPLLFQLDRFLLGYHGSRFVVVLALAGSALASTLSYSTMIYAYAAMELAINLAAAAWMLRSIRALVGQNLIRIEPWTW